MLKKSFYLVLKDIRNYVRQYSNKIELQDYEVVICYKHENETIIFSLVSIIRSMSYQDSKY